jgi:lysophospholipase L1-like esterase
MSANRLFIVLAILLASFLPARAAGPIPAFADGERILFLGDSITRAGPWHSTIALFHETRFPGRRIEWLNAGVSGDTATGALRRLDWDVLARNPDRVVVMFGVNDVSITLYDGDNAPGKVAAREEKITTYQNSMRALIDRLLAAGKKVILVTPPPYEEHGEFPADKVVRPGANAAVTRCADFTRSLAAEHKLPLVDFNGPMNRITTDFQKTNPAFTLMSDRVHPTPGGYLVMAHQFLKAMDVPAVVDVIEPGGTSFTYRPRALPVPFDAGQLRVLPLAPFQDELNREILRVPGLAEGHYEVVMDGAVVGTWWSAELAAGVNLATVAGTPSYLRALEIKKHQDERHGARSIGPRVLVAIRHQVIERAGVDPDDAAAVAALLEDKPEGKQYDRFIASDKESAARAERADNAIAALKADLPTIRVLVRPVAPPPLEKRKALFHSRRTPQAVAALADAFFPLLTLDPETRREVRLEGRPGLDQVAARLAEEDKSGALTAWRDAWLARLLDAQTLGFDSLCSVRPLAVPEAKRAEVIARADALMAGEVVADARPMLPGEVWLAPPPPSPNGENNPWNPGLFQPLAQAYLLTNDARYLERYFAYLDDWALNETRDAQILPTDISDTESKAAGVVGGQLAVLRAIAANPGGISLIPPDTLARVQLRLVRLYPALGIVYHASNPQNWTPGGSAALMSVALAFDEFRFAGYLFDLARHRHENYGVIQFFPDGSETENALWYNVHYRDGAVQSIATARALKALPAEARARWTDPVATDRWIAAQEEKINDRARFFAHMIAPPGRYPIGNRIDSRPVPQGNARLMIEQAAAAGYSDAGRILEALPTKKDPGKDPGFTFSALPWRGSFMFRTGWSADDAYAHFFSSPYPGGGHALRALKNNNNFGLGIAGRDILVGGSFGSYSYDRSPLRVDGREQFFNAGLGNPGVNKNHKGFAVAYIDPEPPAWRIHDDDTFAFAEGEYAGPYGYFLDDHHDRKDYRSDFLAERAAAVFTGVSHHRQVFQLKAAGAWIVVDRVRSDRPREYSLDWRFPMERLTPPANPRTNSKYPHPLAKPEDIRVDAESATVSLSVAGEPGVVLRHFGPKMTFTTAREEGEHLVNDYTLRYKTYDHQHVAGSWKAGAGEELVVTVVTPTRPGAASVLTNINPLGDGSSARGFTAVTSDGKPVGFLAAAAKGTTLRVGPHTAEAETLLVIGDAVLTLGARRDAGPADFVRAKTGAAEVAIHTPIQNMQFMPERTVLVSGETVAITCPTPGVEIRYTLDGSNPKADSPRYSGPITVAKDTVIKARAFRPGVTTMPDSPVSTHVSPVFSASFTVETPIAAANDVAAASLKPGLTAVTRVGDWQDLFFFPERTRTEGRVVAPTLFNRLKPREDIAFAVDYTGYFDAPADGVYTFHAPHELVTSPQEPGYRLHVELAGGSWYPATTRHAYGTWSVALKKGPHLFRVYYADYRQDAVARLNHPGLRINTIWEGSVPELLVSGPGLDRVSVPASVLRH